ncbi:MAG: hydantoinase B/oxoprolinase family protein [Dongiaceae bacterium]
MNYTPIAHRTTSGPRGWDGRSLRDMLLDAERLAKETGHCFGLERIAMKEEEPIRFEKIFSRLRGSLVNARETALNISASPIVKELGELCFALYGPEGDSITLSTGILVHVHTMSEAIKHMIRTNYEENPGINDGDIFINNDPHIGNVHTADVQTFVPIFWEGELIGWAGCVTHVMDIGASTPGSNAVGPTTRYEDGLTLPCVKCGADDRLFRDHVYRCERAVRTPMYWSLDEKTRLAGCHMIRESVRSLIREEGIGTYKQFIRDVLEDSRRSFIERLRQLLIPGVYEAPAFIDSQFAAETRLPEESRKDTMMHAPMRMTIDPKGRLGVDFEGAGKWGLHSFNCTPSAMAGALWVLLTQTVMPNDKVNDGAHYATDIHCPRGSWVNPDVSTTAHGNAWYYLVPSFGGVIRSLSRAFYARGYVEEVLSGYGHDGNILQGGGIDHHRNESAVSNFEMSCVGGGAGIVKDGLDHASVVWNPEGDMGDIEAWEMVEPLLYIGRSVKMDSGGIGRRRGGAGYECMRMLWNTETYELQFVGDGAVFSQPGIFGGYPPGSGYRLAVKNNDLPTIFQERKPYPTGDKYSDGKGVTDLVKGEVILDKRAVDLPQSYGEHDLYLSVMRGGPGLGDPLRRSPDSIEADLRGGVMSPAIAERAYGVVFAIADGKQAIDRERTEKRRREMREARAAKAIPAREWVASERESRVVPKRLSEPVTDMYRSSMTVSPHWARHFRTFWNLDDSFRF